MTPAKFQDRLRILDVQAAAVKAMNLTANDAAEAQTEQLAQGVDGYGYDITNQETGSDEYSDSYARYKGRKKPIDLKDQGHFYQGIKVKAAGVMFNIESADWKNKMLQKRYGTAILRMGDAAKEHYLPILKPVFIKEIKKLLHK